MNFFNNNLNSSDSEIALAINKELARQQNNIELIASENIVSKAVLEAQGSILTNKYAEGYPASRYYGGCEVVDIIENLAISRVKELFGAEYANVQPHSGSQANFAVYFALLQPFDTVMGMDLNSGGHLTHGSRVSFSGKWFKSVSYGLNKTTEEIDYDEVKKIAVEYKPKLIIAGGSAYSKIIDFKKFQDIAKKVGAYLMVDMAHFAGLVAGKAHPNPLKYADVVTSTTHKTLRGPRGGIILTNNKDIAKKINSSIFPGTQGGPLMHVIAAKAVAFKEALQDDFKNYATNVIANAKTMAQAFKDNGFRIVSNGTETHLFMVDLTSLNISGKIAEENLDLVNITCNKNSIPFDTKSPKETSGIRIGTPAITTRGFKETEVLKVVEIIVKVLKELRNNNLSEELKQNIKNEVSTLCKKFPIYEGYNY